MTEWRPVVGYEDAYEVSRDGRVRSIDRLVWNGEQHCLRPGVELVQRVTHLGYIYIKLSKNNRGRLTFAHRIVADAFVDRPEGTTEVNHIDGNKQNNDASNLEWTTRSGNIRHAYANGLNTSVRGSANRSAKLTEDDVVWIRAWLLSGFSQEKVAAVFGVSQAVISQIHLKRTWTHVPEMECV